MKAIFLSAFSIVMIFLALETAQGAPSAPPSLCGGLINDLTLLRKAQHQIIVGLADNHDQMAKSLANISSDLRFYNRPAPLKVINSMNNMARAYEKRGEKGREQANGLDEATADLIQKISQCLKK